VARALGLFFVCAYLGWVVLLGCKATEKNYKVLSFFFDGVPDPNAPVLSEEEEASARGMAPVVNAYIHKPYKEGKCSECHSSAGGEYQDFDKLTSSICLKCHQNETTKFAVMHGPVSTGECMMCHAPHESAIPGMLKEAAPSVCVKCHIPELLSPDPPEHTMADKSCLDCHVAHGSDKHGLLKKTFALASPTTRPTAAPTTRSMP
jgi:predicted CXXCH cytochrome family protein